MNRLSIRALLRRAACAGVLASTLPAGVAIAATPTGDALDRPAVIARDASHAVLLAAAQAGERVVAVGERGLVLTSDDATRTWRQSPTPVSVSLTALRFADATRGYAVGHGGTVLATTDGGQSWARVLEGRKIAQLELEAAKASGEPAALKAAERLVADGADKPLLDLLALDAQRVVVVGAYGIALASEDGGATWTSWRSRLDNPKELHLYAVRKRGDAIVVAGEQGLLRWSTDAGKSFKALTPPYKGSFFTVELPADGEIVVAGLRGNVWRSTDNGANWTQIANPVPASITGSASRADGSLVLVNQAGMVLGLKQGTVQPLTSAALPPLNGVLALPDGALLVVSIQGAKLLDAAGATQQPQKSPAK
jgi:photosystem II stability/assembly factor-like uncharacterized protein